MSEEEKQKRERIKFLLEQNFPEVPESDIEALGEGFTGAHEALLMEIKAHRAVHVNDKQHRDSMRYLVCDRLSLGSELTAAECAWLIFNLSKQDDVRHESKGRATNSYGRFDLTYELIGFMYRDGVAYPEGSIVDRLFRASQNLVSRQPHSFSTLRALYYSEAYKSAERYVRKRGLLV